MRNRTAALGRWDTRPPQPDRIQRDPRIDVRLQVDMRDKAGLRMIDIQNISVRGFRARCGGLVPIGEHVWVTLPELGPVAAQVRWSLCGSFGASFLGPQEERLVLSNLVEELATIPPPPAISQSPGC